MTENCHENRRPARDASSSWIAPSPPSDGGEGVQLDWLPSVRSPLFSRGVWMNPLMQPNVSVAGAGSNAARCRPPAPAWLLILPPSIANLKSKIENSPDFPVAHAMEVGCLPSAALLAEAGGESWPRRKCEKSEKSEKCDGISHISHLEIRQKCPISHISHISHQKFQSEPGSHESRQHKNLSQAGHLLSRKHKTHSGHT